ncbi:glutamine synthetase [Halobacteriales archaeon QS_1_68_17]|nr:MAG: glutamine synthetase [Halobacteriales archaeon QS_1_68_17]
MTTAREVIQRADAEDVELIRLLFLNNSGVPRGRVVDAEGLPGALDDGVNLTHAMQSFNALDRLVPGGKYGPAGEVRVVPDPETFTVLPYDDRAAAMIADLHDLDGRPWSAGPRAQLRRYLGHLRADGYVPRTAFESEYYLVDETEDGERVPFDESACFGTAGMRSAHDVILDTVDALKDQGMGLAVYYPEYGPGQQELVVEHADGVTAADNHVLYKETVAAVAADHGLDASFRPKPFPQLPGTGCHIHFSLWRDGENAFYDPDAEGRYGLSETGRQFVAGVLDHARALTALTAPTVESYDRIAPGMWSSAYTCWGRDNREAVVRVPSADAGDAEATTRIEYKPADNTANPYLALFGLLAAGMDGIERGLEPGEPLDTDPDALDADERADRGIERLPATLAEAVDALEADDAIRSAFGDDLFESYVEVKRSEWEQSTDEDGEWSSDYLSRGF